MKVCKSVLYDTWCWAVKSAFTPCVVSSAVLLRRFFQLLCFLLAPLLQTCSILSGVTAKLGHIWSLCRVLLKSTWVGYQSQLALIPISAADVQWSIVQQKVQCAVLLLARRRKLVWNTSIKQSFHTYKVIYTKGSSVLAKKCTSPLLQGSRFACQHGYTHRGGKDAARTEITPSTLVHDLVLAVSSKGLWLKAGSSFHREDPRERACSGITVAHRRSVISGLGSEGGITAAGFDTGLSLSQTIMRLFAVLEF